MSKECKGLADCHIHTEYSFDAEEKAENMVRRAAVLGLEALCITDHCEMNDPDIGDLKRRMTASVGETSKLAEQYRESGPKVLTGLELGQGLQNLQETERFLADIPVDYVIGSLHNLAGEEDFYFLHYTEESARAYLDRYFEELYEMVEWGAFDCLGHLTYPLRYMVGREGVNVDMVRYQEKIARILRLLAERELALEINTSGLRTDYGETMPPAEYVRLFRKLGGKYITLGSDAHTAADVGSKLREGAKIALAAGFDQIVYYIAHRPYFLDIPKEIMHENSKQNLEKS